MPQTPEYTEVVAGSPELLIGATKHHHEWAHKMVPQVFTEGNRHEGDGGAGSVYHYDIHEDANHVFAGNSKGKIVMEDYNETTLSHTVDYQIDPRYKHFKYHMKYLPGPSPGTSYVKWVIDYEPLSDDTPPPHDLLTNLPRALFKDLPAHLESTKSEKQVTDDSAPLTDDTPSPLQDLGTKSPLAGFKDPAGDLESAKSGNQ